MPLRRCAHFFDQGYGLIGWEQLAFMMVRECRQIVIHELDAAAVEQRSVARDGHQHRPTAMIRYSNYGLSIRHGYSGLYWVCTTTIDHAGRLSLMDFFHSFSGATLGGFQKLFPLLS